MYSTMDMRLEQGPESKVSQTQVGMTEWNLNEAESRCETNKRECKTSEGQKLGKHLVNITEEVILIIDWHNLAAWTVFSPKGLLRVSFHVKILRVI